MKIGIALLLTAVHLTGYTQSGHQRREYLLQHAILLDENKSDFSFLKPLIAEKQFVFLSDGHQGATSKIVFTQLIQYLHEELNFDVLVLETGMYGAEIANREVKALPDSSYFVSQQLITQFISACDASEQLFNYIGATQSTGYPLYLAGLDVEFNRTGHLLFRQLDSVFGIRNNKIILSRGYIQFKNYFDSLATSSSRNHLDTIQKKFLFNYADTLADEISLLNDPSGYWHLIAENVQAFVKGGLYKTPDYNSDTRNLQMFRNLMWLLQMKYPGKKIIVWASPAHLANGFMEDETEMASWFFEKFNRDDVFYIAASNYTTDGKSKTPAGSLSSDLHRAKLKRCMILFHQPGEEHAFINRTKDSRFFDAVLFMDDLESCRWNY